MRHLIYIGGLVFLMGCFPNTSKMIVEDPPRAMYTYDEIRDVGGYSSSLNHVLDAGYLQIYSWAVAWCNDPESCSPDHILLLFRLNTDSFQPSLEAELALLIDGERYIYKDDRASSNYVNHILSTETGGFTIPKDVFEKLAQSKDVRARYQGYELNLSYNNRENYRKLIQALDTEEKESVSSW